MTKKEWAIIGVLVTLVIVVFCLLAFLIMMTIPGINPQVSAPLIPTPILDCNGAYFLNQLNDRVQEFEKAKQEMTTIAPIPTSQIDRLERAYNSLILMPYPNCAATLLEYTRRYMRAYIDAANAMNAGQNSLVVSKAHESEDYQNRATQELHRLYGIR